MENISLRRNLLDECLSQISFHGKVIDIGGKKEKKRGHFRPPTEEVTCWHYANLDKSTNPDFLCDVESIPVPDSMYAFGLLCEIVEHLKEPEKVLIESYRILGKGGTIIISAPFLFPIHADPYDFQRWTEAKIMTVLESIGFVDISIKSMGGVGSVIHDLLFVSFNKIRGRIVKRIAHLALWSSRWGFRLIDYALTPSQNYITTGYFVTARKNK